MMLLPYRAKNPPECVPIATYALIAANTAVYALTTQSLLFVRKSVLEHFAFSHLTFNPLRILTAMFLHGDPFHLIGNMLFLWIFGAAVEGRTGVLKFLALYVAAGFAGALLSNITMGLAQPTMWNLGASGAIMGLAGAYLYMFPFATICVVWGYSFRWELTQWQAQWVILYFMGFDVLDGLLYHGKDGVGHVAHLGGAAVGFLIPLMFRVPRDSEEMSDAQATSADAGGDYSLLGIGELEALVERNPENVWIIMAYCQKAVRRGGYTDYSDLRGILDRHAPQLLEQADPEMLATIVLGIPESEGRMPGAFLIRLGAKLESVASSDYASQCYRRVCHNAPDAPDAETALARLARLTEKTDPNKANAAAIWSELLQRFPHGAQADYAAMSLKRLGTPAVVFSEGKGFQPSAQPSAGRPVPPRQSGPP